MPWLALYADQSDIQTILAWLNMDDEIAFIVPHGPHAWIAERSVAALEPGGHCLWHTPSGPLPLMGRRFEDAVGTVSDPWKGWRERRAGLDPTIPFFGGGPPGVIWFDARPAGREPGSLGLSGFSWIGNRYRAIGQAAPEVTVRWWKRLRRWVGKTGVPVRRMEQVEAASLYAWAFPSAYQKIRSGAPRDANP